jgi:hypothetical protein
MGPRQSLLYFGILGALGSTLWGCGDRSEGADLQVGSAPVLVACKPHSHAQADLAAIVLKARLLSRLLDADQRAHLEVPFTRDNAVRWSNFPISSVQRLGVKFADLSPEQDAAANDLVRTALSNCGVKMVEDIREADDFIRPLNARFNWSHGSYFVGYLGSPSTTKPWMLKIGGHHLGINLTFNGKLPGATPQFNGAEPISFDYRGHRREPMSVQSSAMSAVAQSIQRFPEAKLAGTFSDVVKGVEYSFAPGPRLVGGNDTTFPSAYPTGGTGRGVAFARLDRKSQALVRAAITSYTDLSDGRMSRTMLASYLRADELDQTFIGYSGSPGLSTEHSYVRIDGPKVWIELVAQRAVALPEQLHYHAIWRDKLADYGGEFHH